MLNKDKRYEFLCERLAEVVSINEEKPSTIDSLAKELHITVQEASAVIDRSEEFGLILCRGEDGIFQPGTTDDLLYALYCCGIEEQRIKARKQLICETLEEWMNG